MRFACRIKTLFRLRFRKPKASLTLVQKGLVVDIDPMAQRMRHGFETSFVRASLHRPSNVLDGHTFWPDSFKLNLQRVSP